MKKVSDWNRGPTYSWGLTWPITSSVGCHTFLSRDTTKSIRLASNSRENLYTDEEYYVYLTFMDISTAFDSVNRQKLWRMLAENGA